MSDTNRQQGINSVEVGMRVVKVLASAPGAMTLGDIALGADMAPAKAHRYLVSLIRSGMVQRSVEGARYELGPYALEFSLGCLEKHDRRGVGSDVLRALAYELGESVFSAVWSDAGPVVVDWHAPDRPIATGTRIGTVYPLLMSSTGRLFAAYLPSTLVDARIDRELAELEGTDSAQGPRTRTEVDRLLADVRRRGLSRGINLRWPDISSLSAPVHDARGDLVAAVSAFGYSSRFDSRWDGAVAATLRETAASLSGRSPPS